MATIDAKAREVLAASSSAQSTPPALSRQNSTVIDDDAVLESECLSSTEVDHLEKEDQEMEHEKLCTMPKYIFSFFVKVIAFLPEGKVL